MGGLADPSSKFILVVDDDEGVRSFLETMLKMEGYQVQTATNGTEALDMVRQRAPDVVITDLMMPGTGGYDVLRTLQEEVGDKVPVIVSTARKMDITTEEMIRAEANVVGFL